MMNKYPTRVPFVRPSFGMVRTSTNNINIKLRGSYMNISRSGNSYSLRGAALGFILGVLFVISLVIMFSNNINSIGFYCVGQAQNLEAIRKFKAGNVGSEKSSIVETKIITL